MAPVKVLLGVSEEEAIVNDESRCEPSKTPNKDLDDGVCTGGGGGLNTDICIIFKTPETPSSINRSPKLNFRPISFRASWG